MHPAAGWSHDGGAPDPDFCRRQPLEGPTLQTSPEAGHNRDRIVPFRSCDTADQTAFVRTKTMYLFLHDVLRQNPAISRCLAMSMPVRIARKRTKFPDPCLLRSC